jgi:hypothetical protein
VNLPDEDIELQKFYQEMTRRHALLIVIDNAQNVDQVQQLMPGGSSAVIAAVQNGQGAKELGLPVISLEGLAAEDAARLLRAVSERLKKNTPEELSSLAYQCGYLPLSLRLVASLLKNNPNWTPERLAERIKRERELLSEAEKLSRLDVKTVLSLTYEALGEILQYRFRMLAAFNGSFSASAAAYIWGCDKDLALEDIRKLYSYHLLEWQDKGKAYCLHRSFRTYALERLLEHPLDAQLAAQRHAKYYLRQGQLFSASITQIQEVLNRDARGFIEIWPQLKTAWLRMAGKEKGWPRTENGQQWLSLAAIHLGDTLTSHLPEYKWRPFIESGLDAANRLEDKQQEAHLALWLGRTYHKRQDMEWAKLYILQAVALFQDIHDRLGAGEAMTYLGLLHAENGDSENAYAFFERGLGMMPEDAKMTVFAHQIAVILERQGEYALAEQLMKLVSPMMPEHNP